jgi:hypothetical protein
MSETEPAETMTRAERYAAILAEEEPTDDPEATPADRTGETYEPNKRKPGQIPRGDGGMLLADLIAERDALKVDGRLDQIIGAAAKHGHDSEPDHEVGDLQDALRLAWAELTPAKRKKIHAAYFETHDHWDEET